MSTLSKVLEILEQNKGMAISGEEMAKEIDVSRNMVWKSINQLKNQGYKISSVANKGYTLREENDILSTEGIQKYLKNSVFDIEVLKTVNSTNTYLKELASKGEKEFKVVISEEQTEGKGRIGNSFLSPKSKGVYCSMLLRPQKNISDCIFLTCLSAVSVVEGIEKQLGIKTKIKWVNDVYLKNKKICGILTEASFDMENLITDYVVVGIGINIGLPEGGYPEELKEIIGNLEEEKISIDRSKLIAEILEGIHQYYTAFNKEKIIALYKTHSLILGKNISFIYNGEEYEGKVENIDENAKLIVETKNQVLTLSSGEIRIKKESLFNEN